MTTTIKYTMATLALFTLAACDYQTTPTYRSVPHAECASPEHACPEAAPQVTLEQCEEAADKRWELFSNNFCKSLWNQNQTPQEECHEMFANLNKRLAQFAPALPVEPEASVVEPEPVVAEE